ncbi:unnamed protein product [Discula destructiva]
MQSPQMICLPCRSQLFAAALHRARVPSKPTLWQASASARTTSSASPAPIPTPGLRSNSTTQSTSNSDFDDDFVISLDDPDIEEPWRTTHEAPNAHDTIPADDRRAPGRFSTVPPRRNVLKKFKARDASLKLFEKVVKQQSAEAEANQRPRDLSPQAVEFYTNLGKLRPMMEERPIEECFDFFLTKLWDKSPFEGRNRLLKQRGAYLLGKVARAKIKDCANELLPSMAQITQLFHEMESLSGDKWTEMTMGLIKAIIGISPLQESYPSPEAHTLAMARKEVLLNDLIDSWIMFNRYKMRADDSSLQTSAEAEFRLPEINPAELREYGWQKNYKKALGCIFPDWVSRVKEIPAVAIATFVLLVDPAHSNIALRQRAKPLLVPIGHVVSACPFRQPAINELLGANPAVLLYVLGQWDMLIRRLRGRQEDNLRGEHKEEDVDQRAEGGEKKEAELARKGEEIKRKLEDSIVTGGEPQVSKRIRRYTSEKITYALGMGDVLTLEDAWRSFWHGRKYAEDRETLQTHAGVFNYFILAFTALKKPSRAIDVWECMTRDADLPPTLLTWHSMIEGCRRAKNAAGIENVWKKLVAWAKQVDQPLDDKAWASRIVGLIESGEPEAALRALNDMARLSKTARGAKVTIDVVNATVAGLLRINASAAADKVLTWAAQQYDGDDKIEPNVITYNTLLGPMVRQGQVAQIKSTLQMMTANDIKPDAATYTILLEGLISRDLDPVRQAAGAQELLVQMENDGVAATQETYARMLHLVLRDGRHTQNHAKGAAGAILDHMRRRDEKISPHIYTVLVDHYFARTPPAIAEVDNLLQERERLDVGVRRLDRVFWERVIKGYALAGDTDRAFTWFDKLNNVGSAITLDTLDALLRSLVQEGRHDVGRRVVDSIKMHRGGSVGRENNSVRAGAGDPSWDRYWKHGFWAFAMDCGLLSAAEWRELKAGRFEQVDGALDPTTARRV